MSLLTLTVRYRRWVRRHVPLDDDELAQKDAVMAEGAFPLLRGTFYRWAQQFPKRLPNLAAAPAVLAVGDLHVENFGMWRDCDGRLAWGVNDFDECAPMPYTVDLVRLATSAVLAVHEGQVAANSLKSLRPAAICRAILTGYRDGLQHPEPFVLAERNAWLRDMAIGTLSDHSRGQTRYEHFFEIVRELEKAGTVPPAVERLIRRSLPDPKMAIEIGHRVAGVGSLGRPRYTAVASNWKGGVVAREAKPVLPSAWLWARDPAAARQTYYDRIVARAVRSPNPYLIIGDGWLARRLGPDTGRIELADVPLSAGVELLQAMGKETANVHAGTRVALRRVPQHLDTLPATWLEDAVAVMQAQVNADLAAFRSQRAR